MAQEYSDSLESSREGAGGLAKGWSPGRHLYYSGKSKSPPSGSLSSPSLTDFHYIVAFLPFPK